MPVFELGCAVSNKCLSPRFLLNLIACLLPAACAELSPQKFSDRLSPPHQAGQPSSPAAKLAVPTVAEARADVESVQRKYTRGIERLSNITPQTSAAMIGLSAVALYKGLTSGSTKGIAALGVGGSGIWAYGATMTSQPRQRVYGEGVRALSCAVTAASPYDRDETWRTGLNTEISEAASAFEDLRDWQEKYAHLNTARTMPGKKAAPASAECKAKKQLQLSDCGKADPSASSISEANRLAACSDEIAARAKICKSGGDTPDKVINPPQALTNAFKRVSDEQVRLAQAIANGRSLQGAIDIAGTALQDRSTDIQIKVSTELLKTEPDPTAVLATLKNLKQVAAVVAGTPLPVPGANVAQTGAGQVQSGSLRPAPSPEESAAAIEVQRALDDLEERLRDSTAKRVHLESRLAVVNGSIQKINRTLEQCEFTAPGAVALVVSPSATDINVPLGHSQSFTVSGGTGIPLGSVNSVAGAKMGNFPDPKIERGTFNFSYEVPTDAQVGDQVIVMFTDASHQGLHEVTITATAAKPAPASTPAPANQPLPGDIPPANPQH